MASVLVVDALGVECVVGVGRMCTRSGEGAAGSRLLLCDQNNIYKFITLLPKDYCLIPGNSAIKIVETRITYTNLKRYHQRTIV